MSGEREPAPGPISLVPPLSREKVVIFGTADLAQVVWAHLRGDPRYEVSAFAVHQQYVQSPELFGLPVVALERIVERYPPAEHAMFVAIGYSRLNRLRAEMHDACRSLGYRLATYVSAGAFCAGDLDIGDNCFIFAGSVVQPFARIGDSVIVSAGGHIGHHARIGDNCFIANQAVISDHVTLGRNCFVGANATIGAGVTVAPHCVIGAGALVLSDAKEGEVYKAESTRPAGVPSSRLRI